MAAKAILVLCAQALLVQFSFSQCVGPIVGAYDGLARGVGCAPFTPTASAGGSFVVTSASPVAPTGVKVVSENVYEGALTVGGNLPLLGSVGVEGEFCTAGAGAVSYGCGDDAVAIVAEDGPVVTGIVDPLIAGPGYGLGAGYGLGTGCGFGAGYGFAPAFGFASGYGGATPFGYGYGLGYGTGYGLGYGTGYGFGYGLGGYGPGYGCGCGAIY